MSYEIRRLSPQERVQSISAYGGLTQCQWRDCENPAEVAINLTFLLCKQHQQEHYPFPVTVSAYECWYYSRRADLMRRGIRLRDASYRAQKVARRLERRYEEQTP